MKRLWTIVFLTGAVLIAASVFFYFDRVSVGDPAPDFSLQSADGKTVALSDFKGSPVIVHFFGTWCEHCVREAPSLDRLANDYAGKIAVLALSTDTKSDADVVRRWASSIMKHMIVLFDSDGMTADEYGNFSYPNTIIVSKDGIVVDRFEGSVNWDASDVRSKVDSLL